MMVIYNPMLGKQAVDSREELDFPSSSIRQTFKEASGIYRLAIIQCDTVKQTVLLWACRRRVAEQKAHVQRGSKDPAGLMHFWIFLQWLENWSWVGQALLGFFQAELCWEWCSSESALWTAKFCFIELSCDLKRSVLRLVKSSKSGSERWCTYISSLIKGWCLQQTQLSHVCIKLNCLLSDCNCWGSKSTIEHYSCEMV